MSKRWVVVANASVARLLAQPSKDGALTERETLLHPEARQKASETGRDRPGRGNSDHRPAPVHFEPRTSERHKAQQRFAKELAARLDLGLREGEFDSLWLFAPQPFLNELNAALSDAVNEHLQISHDSDFTHLDVPAIDALVRHPRDS